MPQVHDELSHNIIKPVVYYGACLLEVFYVEMLMKIAAGQILIPDPKPLSVVFQKILYSQPPRPPGIFARPAAPRPGYGGPGGQHSMSQLPPPKVGRSMVLSTLYKWYYMYYTVYYTVECPNYTTCDDKTSTTHFLVPFCILI